MQKELQLLQLDSFMRHNYTLVISWSCRLQHDRFVDRLKNTFMCLFQLEIMYANLRYNRRRFVK